MPKAVDSPITKLLKLADQLTPEERQAAMDILRHANRREAPKAPPARKARQKAAGAVGEASS